MFDNFNVPIAIWYAYRAIELCVTLSSVLTFLVISADRWLVLAFPLRARAWRTKRLLHVMLGTIWALGLIGGLLQLATDLEYVNSNLYSIFQPLLVFVPLLIMIVLWGLIARIAIISSKANANSCSNARNNMEMHDQRAAAPPTDRLNASSVLHSNPENQSANIITIAKANHITSTIKFPPEEIENIMNPNSEETEQIRDLAYYVPKCQYKVKSGVSKGLSNKCNQSWNSQNALNSGQHNATLNMQHKKEKIIENRALITAATIIG